MPDITVSPSPSPRNVTPAPGPANNNNNNNPPTTPSPTPPAPASDGFEASASLRQKKAAEKALGVIGHRPGPVDGRFTAATRAAIKTFQRARDLPQTGELDRKTYVDLRAVEKQTKKGVQTAGLGGRGQGVGPATLRALRSPPLNLNTVKGCAEFLLRSPNVSFWTGLSTGSDRVNLQRLANGQRAQVPATGGAVIPKLSMMQALVAMAKAGPIMINALTGGSHSTNSNHYRGTAVDMDISVGNTAEIEAIGRRFGGIRNFERTHIHMDF